MSTIKSSNEDIVVNADGVGNVIDFQENGVTKFTSETVAIKSGVTDTFTTSDGKTVTVTDGIITGVV